MKFDRIVLLGLFAFGALLFAGTFAIEQGAGSSPADVGARFAPQLFSGALMIFCALAVILRDSGEEHHLGADAVVAVVALIAVAYAFALPVLGYVISTFAALMLVLIAVRAGAWWRMTIFSVTMTGALYLVFERIMLVGLPAGPLGF